MSLISRIFNEYDRLSTVDKANKAEWNALVTSNLFAPTVTALYLYFCLYAGPLMMRDRKPFSMKYLVMAYNALQMACNAYLFVQWTQYVWIRRDSFGCIGVERPGTAHFDWIVNLEWMTLLNRMVDMVDTIFHVFRKKDSHISFLHIYHHATAVFFGWYLARYFPGSLVSVFLVWNSFVHFFMYSYYFASAQSNLYPIAARYKKRITQLQLIQFITLVPYCVYILSDSNCSPYPRGLMWFGLFQDVVFLYLFGRFYYRAYIKNKKFKGK